MVPVLPPEPLASFLAERGYLPRGALLIKRVLALPGTQVCRRGLTITAYDHAYGEARMRIGAWKDDYNDHRPHSSLGNLTPSEFASNLALEKQAA